MNVARTPDMNFLDSYLQVRAKLRAQLRAGQGQE